MNRVLIIEDEISMAESVKEALKLNNVVADIANDGEKGLEKFKSSEYDLVLLDLKMPKMSGEQVLSEIRRINPYMDVIVYTAHKEFEDLKTLTNIGIDGYVNKGADAELNEIVDKILALLSPMSKDEIKVLVRHTPKELFECE